MSGSEVTSIVPVWNRRDLLERLLCGLRAQTRAAAEVLVVDDGGQDGSAELAESMGARFAREIAVLPWAFMTSISTPLSARN